MDLLQLIKSRRSVREYKTDRIPRDEIAKIVEAGIWAPSAHNMQPWRFVLVEDTRKIEYISDILMKKAEGLLTGFNIVVKDTAAKIRNAPILLLVYSDRSVMDKFKKFGSPYDGIGEIFDIQSVANAVMNMMLLSHSIDIGSTWYGMALFCEEEINGYLGQSNKLMAVLGLGRPRTDPKKSGRLGIAKVLSYL